MEECGILTALFATLREILFAGLNNHQSTSIPSN